MRGFAKCEKSQTPEQRASFYFGGYQCDKGDLSGGSGFQPADEIVIQKRRESLKNGATKGNDEMKNWLIYRLGGVPKQTYMAAVDSYEDILATYTNMIHKLEQENAAMKAEKAEMEKAAEMVSANLSETISRLNEERKVSNGLMAKMTAQTQKIEELQAEIEAKNAELARVKSEIIAISKIKADTALKTENQRLRAEVELLKRNKFKRGRK